MRIVKSEWHSVEKRYGMELERYELDEIYPESNKEENDELWQQILDGVADIEEIKYDGELQGHYIDWDWLDEDDWWTDRKGGYDVTYEVEADYVPPKSDEERITDLRNEVNELCKQLGVEERYDTRPMHIRFQELRDLLQKEMEDGEE